MYTKYHTKIKVGDQMESKLHGLGECTKIDYKSKAFRYCFHFSDGTIKWMSDEDCASESTH